MCSEIAGAAIAGPAFECAEAGDALGFGEWIDGAVADHLGEAWEAGDAVGADAVAVGFGGEAGGECGAGWGEAEADEGLFDGVGEVVEGDAEHGLLERMRGGLGGRILNKAELS